MTRKNQIILRPGNSNSSIYRRQPLLQPSPSSSGGRIAELAGGTAAECAAVWCCCPCSLVNLLVLAVYKLPAGLCKKAIKRRRRRRMKKKGLLPLPKSASSSRHGGCGCGGGWEEREMNVTVEAVPEAVVVVGSGSGGEQMMMSMVMDKELMELEKEMWEKFYSTGFWRSPSQREHLEEYEQQHHEQ